MPLFGKTHKAPMELLRHLRENVKYLEERGQTVDKKTLKAKEDISKCLALIKNILCGGTEQDMNSELTSHVAQEMCAQRIVIDLVANLHWIDFESRKDVTLLFNNLLRRQIGTRQPMVEYILKNREEILFVLLKGYENQEIALHCGSMLRECCRHDDLVHVLLYSPHFYDMFLYVDMSPFDIASDAFCTFKELLTRHKKLCAEFFETNYDEFFGHYAKLQMSDNYVTKRQALKLLGELLVDRWNFSAMSRYISSPDNLRLTMNLLKTKSRNIQLEAFHIFKLFVANPDKPAAILEILLRNREKLVLFLNNGFNSDRQRSEDERFNDELQYLVKQIKNLKVITAESS